VPPDAGVDVPAEMWLNIHHLHIVGESPGPAHAPASATADAPPGAATGAAEEEPKGDGEAAEAPSGVALD
jgi:hypothetical protein